MTKKIACLLIAIILLFMTCINATAITPADAVAQIKEKAETDGYRFIQVDQSGLTEDIKSDLAENDSIYLSDATVGSVKIIVLDADTGKPVKDAACMLSFSSSRFTVNSDGSHTQTANPFLLFDLGKTPDSGELMFNDTYFYTTYEVEPDAQPFADSLSVTLANLVDKDPEIAIDYTAQPFFSTTDPTYFETIVSRLNGQTTLLFSALKAIVKEVTGDMYTEFIRNMFNYDFCVFSNNVMVKVSDAPQFERLNQKELTIGALRTYIDENRDLFDQYVAARYYPDFGGFTPNYVFDYNPEYDYVRTYKNGTQKSETSSAYLGMTIFDYNSSEGGTGYAVNTSGFAYKTYVYADGYKEGLAIGSLIYQDFVDKDVTMKVYLSKDMSPLVAYEKTNAIYGILKDENDKPIEGATVQIEGSTLKAVTNAEGYFSLMKLKLEEKGVKLTIISPEDGESLAAAAVIDGKKYALDDIPLDLTGEDGIYQVTLVKGMSAAGGTALNPLMFILIAAVLLVIIAVIILVVVVNKKKKSICAGCGAPLQPNAIFCDNCGKRI